MQIILDDLSPEEKKARFGGFETADIPLFETHFYEVNYSHVFTIGNDLVSYSKRKYTVKVKCRESLAKAFTIDTEIIEDHTDFMDGEEFSKKYMEILRLMMEVKKHLVCLVNCFGTVRQIINMEEIIRKWNRLKENLQKEGFLKSPIPREELIKIIEAGDCEFRADSITLLNNVNSDMGYVSLFCSFLRGNGKLEKTFKSFILDGQATEITLNINEYIEGHPDGNLVMARCDSHMNLNSYRKAFLNEYDYLGQPFKEYQFEVIMLNYLNKDYRWLEKGKFAVNELVNKHIKSSLMGEISHQAEITATIRDNSM